MDKRPFIHAPASCTLILEYPTMCFPGNIPWLDPELAPLTLQWSWLEGKKVDRSEKFQGPNLSHENKLREAKDLQKTEHKSL